MLPLPPLGLTIKMTEMTKKQGKDQRVRHQRVQLYSSLCYQFMLNFQMLDDVIFHAIFRMSPYADDLLSNLIGPGLASKLDKRMSLASTRRKRNRRALYIDEIMCLSLRILGGSTYIDASWGFNVGTPSV